MQIEPALRGNPSNPTASHIAQWGTRIGLLLTGLARGNSKWTLLAAWVAMFPLCTHVDAQGRFGRGGGGGQPASAQPAAAPALSKSMALRAVIGALAMNNSAQAQQSLERIVTGKTPLGGHAKEAAQLVIVQFAMRPSPASEAFFQRVFADPDDQIRPPGDKIYPAAALRSDTAHVLGKVASPELRLALAKIATQNGTPADTRSAIEDIVRLPLAANFAAQVEIFRSASVSPGLKLELGKMLLAQNVSAAKQALRLAPSAKSVPGGAAFPFSGPPGGGAGSAGAGGGLLAGLGQLLGGGGKAGPGSGPGMPAGIGGAPPEVPRLPTAGAAAPQSPFVAALEMLGKMQSQQPVDPGAVARELWSPEFVESICQGIERAKSDAALKKDRPELVGALASIPLNMSREKLQDYLKAEWTNGPGDFGKTDEPIAGAPLFPAAQAKAKRDASQSQDDSPFRGARGSGLRGGTAADVARMRTPGGGLGMGGPMPIKPQTNDPTQFGANWFDPGSLIVLKTTIPYEDRPKEKHRSHAQSAGYGMYGGNANRNRRMSAAAEKRAEEKAEKEKLQQTKYQWRAAIELAVREWDKRLAGVTEEGAGAAGASGGSQFSKSFAADDSESIGSDDSAKGGAKGSKKKASTAKNDAPAATAPKPAVAMPFELHPGGTIQKEYHAQWPQDLPSGLSAAVPDSLVVHYVRLAGNAAPGRILAHYHNVIVQTPQTSLVKPWRMREISDGKWLDAVQKIKDRTRSIDVVATWEETADEKGKKTQPGDVTVEILVVEIKSLPSDESNQPGKKQVAEKNGARHAKSADE